MRLLKCDVTQLHPLGSAQVPPADFVLTLLTLKSTCTSVNTYPVAMWGLASLLKPGRHLVTMVTLHSQHYMVSLKEFFRLHLEKETVESALKELRCDYRPISYSETCSNNKGICFVVACKGSSV